MHTITKIQVADLNNRLTKALKFLESGLQKNRLYPSYIAPARQMCRLDLQVEEVFSTALIAEALPQESSIRKNILENFAALAQQGTFFTFFTTAIYPPDTDTNSLIYSLLLLDNYDVKSQADLVWNKIKKYANDQGILQVWLSDDRQNQIDPIVSINAEILAALIGVPSPRGNKNYILQHLHDENFWNGTRYYHSPDAFLYFLCRLCQVDPEFENDNFSEIRKAIIGRKQTTCHPLDLAHRLIVMVRTNVDFGFELEKLLSLQQADGGLPADAIFHFGARRGYFGSRYLTTALFIKALETIKNL